MMRWIMPVMGLVAVASLARAEEQAEIAAAFKGYKQAILAQKGEEAVGWVTRGTVDEYQRYMDWALDADRETVEGMSMMNRVQVLSMRHRMPAQELRKANGRSIFVHAVDRDWIGKDGEIRMELTEDVAVAGDRATGGATIGGEPAPMKFHFRKEDAKWRLDLIELIKFSGQALQAAAERAGMEENELILKVLKMVSGTKPAPTIWEPVGRE